MADDEDVKGEESEGEESEMEDVEESEMEDVEDEVGACVEVKGGDANQEESVSGETMQGDWLEAAVFKHPKFKQMSFDFDDLGQSLQRLGRDSQKVCGEKGKAHCLREVEDLD